MQYKLFQHQEEFEKYFYSVNRRALCSMVMGGGKTLSSLHLTKTNDKKAIIVCPIYLKDQWEEAILKFDFCKKEDIKIIYDRKDLYDFNWKCYKYVIMHYEILRDYYIIEHCIKYIISHKLLKTFIPKEQFTKMIMKPSVYNKSKLRIEEYMNKNKNKKSCVLLSEKSYDIYSSFFNIDHKEYILILDETYKVKNYKSQLSQAYNLISNYYDWFGVVALDGTPISSRNLFTIYRICNIVRDNSITWNELMQYGYQLPYGAYVFRNLPKFNQLLKERLMFRVNKEDIKKEQIPINTVNIHVKNSKEAHKLVEHIKDNTEFFFEIYSTLRALDSYYNIDVKQDTGTELYELINKYKIREFINKEKVEALDGILESAGEQKVLIFTNYKTTVNWLKEHLKEYKLEYVWSGMKDIDIKKSNFLKGDSQIMITTDVLAKGFDCVDVDYLVNFDLPTSSDTYMQRLGRIDRITSLNGKNIYNLVSDIVEIDIEKILDTKQILFMQVVDGKTEDDSKSEINIMRKIAEKFHMKLTKGEK